MSDTVALSREIHAPAEEVWALVSDLPRMGEWSDENTGGRWIDQPSAPVTGAVFKGTNRNGKHRWSTRVKVTEATPGEAFRFEVTYMRIPIARWGYEFTSTESGCQVTESWTDRRPGWFKPLSEKASGVADREERTKAAIEHTLELLAKAAESPTEQSAE